MSRLSSPGSILKTRTDKHYNTFALYFLIAQITLDKNCGGGVHSERVHLTIVCCEGGGKIITKCKILFKGTLQPASWHRYDISNSLFSLVQMSHTSCSYHVTEVRKGLSDSYTIRNSWNLQQLQFLHESCILYMVFYLSQDKCCISPFLRALHFRFSMKITSLLEILFWQQFHVQFPWAVTPKPSLLFSK